MQYEFFDQGPASWQIDTSGTVATQVLNADASALIGDIVLTNDHIEGTWQVQSGNDDDFMGFVFGWQDEDHFISSIGSRRTRTITLLGLPGRA